MNLLCKLNGHTLKGGNTLLFTYPAGPNGENYQWFCGRCGHAPWVRYGDKPADFGPRLQIVLPRVRLRKVSR